ncbi:MAG TPA: hypothetical protein VI278_14870 [Nitrososphaeraceae archaeon]
MNKNKNKSIVMVVAVLSSILILSSALGKPVSAQTSNSNDINNYKDFKNCLSNAESTKNFATKKEIKACFNPIYNPLLNSTGSGSADTSAPSAGQ